MRREKEKIWQYTKNRIQRPTSSPAKVCLQGHTHCKRIHDASSPERAAGCRNPGDGNCSCGEQGVCAGGLSPLGTSVRLTAAQEERKNKFHLCMKFFSKAAGVLCREWILRFTRSSRVEVEALSSFKRLQKIEPKKEIRISS